ncbi:hypothetical protein D3C74_49150 [compost metagenome]
MDNRGAWMRVTVMDTKKRNGVLAVKMGADDPDTLDFKDTFEAAKAVAKRRGYKTVRGMTVIKVYGQNRLAERVFFYRR